MSSDLCVNGAHHSVMLFQTIQYFNSTANSQVKYLYLYCLAQQRFLLVEQFNTVPRPLNVGTVIPFCSRLSIFQE